MDLRALVVTGVLVGALVGCGDEDGGRDAAPATTTGPGSDAATPAGPPPQIELRAVLATDRAPAPDSLVKQQLDALDCDAEVVPAAPERPTAACDDEGTKYVLEPARVVGGVESAVAAAVPGGAGWAVTLDLDDAAAGDLADLTGELAGTRRQIALLLEGRVATAPTVERRVEGGVLLVAGAYDEESARALADRLAAG